MSKVSFDIENRVSPDFQRRILEIIDDEELTKKEFSKKVGVSPDVIIRATLYGILPCVQSLIKMADNLDVSVEYLIGISDDKNFFKSENPATFIERLTFLASEKGEKFSKIAHSMPFPENYFYDWKREKTLPSLENLRAIADYFDVSIDYLIGRSDYKN